MSVHSIGSVRFHSKAREAYVSVEFRYPNSQPIRWDVPIAYPRTGVDLSEADENEIEQYINKIHDICDPKLWDKFLQDQRVFWSGKSKSAVTKPFFDVLASSFEWKSVESDFPKNPNWARRIQDLKEMGFTIATNTKMYDARISSNCTHLLLLPIPRGGVTGYETWSAATRSKIVRVLASYDAYEARKVRPESLLPDHKFPEVRWDEATRRDSLDELSDEEIRRDFQLITNQRNQQKREACRNCRLTNVRGYPFGIAYFYSGSKLWPKGVPVQGKEAEQGCVGCGWYDLEKWRMSLNAELEQP